MKPLGKILKKIPGFRSGKWWKGLLASIGYLFLFFIFLGIVLPSPKSVFKNIVIKHLKSEINNKALNRPIYKLEAQKILEKNRELQGRSELICRLICVIVRL